MNGIIHRGVRRLLTLCLIVTLFTGAMAAEPMLTTVRAADSFDFPTTENDATFCFVSYPDLFNWNIKYPQPGWEDAVGWFLDGMKKEGPAFSLIAGDIMDARWWTSPEEVRQETQRYWGGFRKRLEDKDIEFYLAPGDHEYGDDQGLRKMNLTPVFAEQFVKIFDMPENGPPSKKGLAYSFVQDNLAIISVDTFEDAGNRLSMTVSGEQLAWLKEQLKKYQDKTFLIVQGHVPVIGPVRSKNSSANMLEGGRQSEFWQTMIEHGVDVYLCGEHHRITAGQHDGIWQIVHGALWGTQTDLNYLRGSVWPERLELELFRFDVENGGRRLTQQHPHRGNGGPWSEVTIAETTRRDGPRSVGKLVIEATGDENRTVLATGEFDSSQAE